ncbi:hypothetical protein D3C74_91090 [compost metagenome]
MHFSDDKNLVRRFSFRLTRGGMNSLKPMKKWMLSLGIACVSFLMTSSVVHAGWFEDITNDLVQSLIVKPVKEFIIGIFETAMVGLQQWVFHPVNIMEELMVKETIQAIQYVALGLLVLNVMVEILKSMYEEGYGQGGLPIDAIITKTIKSFALIYLSPWIMTDILLKANDKLLEVVSMLGGNEIMVTIQDSFLQENTILNGGFMIMSLVFLIYGIGLVVLAILAGFRYVQLIYLTSLSPLLAVSSSGKGEAYNTWIRESVAVVFTQSFQCWSLWLASTQLLKDIGSSTFSTDNAWRVLIATAYLIGTITGPSFLKKWLHSSGIGGAAGGAAKAGIYRMMTKTAIGR